MTFKEANERFFHRFETSQKDAWELFSPRYFVPICNTCDHKNVCLVYAISGKEIEACNFYQHMEHSAAFEEEMKDFTAMFDESKEEAKAALKEQTNESNFFETKIEPLKTFTFLRDWYFDDKYNLQPARSGISADGDPFLVYKPRRPKKSDIKEVYIEIYKDSVYMLISTSSESKIEGYVSLEELCRRLNEIMECLI